MGFWEERIDSNSKRHDAAPTGGSGWTSLDTNQWSIPECPHTQTLDTLITTFCRQLKQEKILFKENSWESSRGLLDIRPVWGSCSLHEKENTNMLWLYEIRKWQSKLSSCKTSGRHNLLGFWSYTRTWIRQMEDVWGF